MSRIISDPIGRLDEIKPAYEVPFDTTEVRWFFSGALPTAYVDWFSDPGGSAIVEIRCDSYWVDGSHSTGLKQRGHGPLEVKLRRGSTRLVDLGDGLRGRIEEWRKIRPAEPPSANSNELGQWCQVQKVIQTRTYGVGSAGNVRPLDHRDLATRGCDIELASVVIAGTAAWTFALEAWGPPEERRGMLTGALDALVQSSPLPPDFRRDLDHDMGYPERLATMTVS
jgi:hypothetical protein